jgi:ABC-2 type transport system ATP-binding protein
MRPLVDVFAQVPLAITADHVVTRARHAAPLHDLSLQVPVGACYALLGPAGAGTTTVLRLLLNLETPVAGQLMVLGLPTHSCGPEVRAQIGYLPPTPELGRPWLRVRDLLALTAAYYPAWDVGYADMLLAAFGLSPHARSATLTIGETRTVQWVMALAHRPPILLLDDPMAGLDPSTRTHVLDVLTRHLDANQPTTVIATHDPAAVEGLIDHVGVLAHGRLVAQASVDTLHRGLRRYRAAIPDAWPGCPPLRGRVLTHAVHGHGIELVVWGHADAVVADLVASGARVIEVSALRLADATMALLCAAVP